MTLRYHKARFYPRKLVVGARDSDTWVPDPDKAQDIRVGIQWDRGNRAEVRGLVDVDVYNARLPWGLEGVGVGSVLRWDGSDWDIIAPPAKRPTRTHSIRHMTVVIRRRPRKAVPDEG